MSEIPTCKRCTHQCCENVHPMVTPRELYVIEKKLGIVIPTYIDNNLEHLSNIPAYSSRIRIQSPCPMFKKEFGCILSHDERPVICQLIPWIPHLFRTNDWDILLDTNRCKELSSDWLNTYDQVKKEFSKILATNPDWKQ